MTIILTIALCGMVLILSETTGFLIVDNRMLREQLARSRNPQSVRKSPN